MRYTLLFLSFSILMIGCGDNKSNSEKDKTVDSKKESADQKKESKPANAMFGIKAAKIIFNYTGGPETGTETLYWDEYGSVAVLEVDKKNSFGTIRQTIIWSDKKSTIIDHEKKTVATSSFRPKATEPPSIADTDENTRKNIGYEKLADETVAGKNCEVWFNAKQNIKYWLWNKIDLKLENQGAYTKEASSVEEINEIPASVMAIPGDYKQ